jgi:hypothetical protein
MQNSRSSLNVTTYESYSSRYKFINSCWLEDLHLLSAGYQGPIVLDFSPEKQCLPHEIHVDFTNWWKNMIPRIWTARSVPGFSLKRVCALAPHTAKTKCRKFETKYSQERNIGASVPISTFMCLWANYIFPRWVCLFCWRKYVDRSWEYINRSQTHECGN